MLLLFTRVMYIVCIVYFFHFSFCFLRIIYVVHDVLLILHVVSLSRGSIVSMGLSLSLSLQSPSSSSYKAINIARAFFFCSSVEETEFKIY